MNERKKDAVTYLAYFATLMTAVAVIVMLVQLVLGPVRSMEVAELAFWRSLAVFGVTLALSGRIVGWW